MLDKFVFAALLMEKKQEGKEEDIKATATVEQKNCEAATASATATATTGDMPFLKQSSKDRKDSLKNEECSSSSRKNSGSGTRKNSLKNQEGGKERKDSLIKQLLNKRNSLSKEKKRDSVDDIEQLSQAQIPQLINSAQLVGDRRAAVSEKDQDQRETLKESLEYIQRMEYLQEFQIM